MYNARGEGVSSLRGEVVGGWKGRWDDVEGKDVMWVGGWEWVE